MSYYFLNNISELCLFGPETLEEFILRESLLQNRINKTNFTNKAFFELSFLLY